LKLTIFDNTIPIKAIPEKSLDQLLNTQFMYWLSNLLSLKADSEEKVLNALPAIKKHFWSLGMHEVKKAFEMYADGELRTQPRSNYFDRVLVGQIFKEYREIKPRPKKELPVRQYTQEEKDLLTYEGCLNCYEEWKHEKRIIPGYTWVHDHLEEKGLFNFTDDEKKGMWSLSKKRLEAQSKEVDYQTAKEIMRKLENPKDMARINEYKRIRLEYYFGSIKHLKEVLK